MANQLELHPAHGPHEPTTGTPRRRPGSVRRTSTIDSLRSGDLDRRVSLAGRARDLITHMDGTTTVAGSARMAVDIAYTGGPVVQEIETTPHVVGVENLIGRIASAGFRAAIDADTTAAHGELIYLLLDDIPVATLVSGYAVGHAVKRGDLTLTALTTMRAPGPPAHGPNMCAGFQVGGTIMNALADGGGHALVTGPVATEIVDADDTIGWHEFPGPLRPDSMRRWRRADLWKNEDGLLEVDTFFRDSHLASDGVETIIHEYTVAAVIDPVEMRILECEATPRVLPWQECPQAAGSGARLAGMAVSGLRAQARAELLGITACTHLTDQLREIEDVATLLALLPS
ncbi:DUF2889 domain-containing protein [Jatrophihabitans sp. DSM 45814]